MQVAVGSDFRYRGPQGDPPVRPCRRASPGAAAPSLSTSGETESSWDSRPATQPAALPRLPALPAAPRDLLRPVRGGDPAARRLGGLGQAMPPAAVRQARTHDHRAAIRDRRGGSERAEQCSGRASEHPAAPYHPPSVRLPLPSRRDRTRNARPRRALCTPTGSVTQPTEHAGDPNMGGGNRTYVSFPPPTGRR
jgi:hypothetical protein